MVKIYLANNIEILRMSWKKDSSGTVIPPEAEIKYPSIIDVLYGDEDSELRAGKATLKRVNDSIVANLVLKTNSDTSLTEDFLSKLYPAVSFNVDEAKGNIIYKLEIVELFLSHYKNDDVGIKRLGDRILRKRTDKELN